MHADKQMPLAIHVLQPPVDEIVSRLEIEPGKRFIDPKKIDFSRSRDDFGKEDPSFLTIALGKEAIPLVLDLQSGQHFAPHGPIFSSRIKALNNLDWGEAGREIDIIR